MDLPDYDTRQKLCLEHELLNLTTIAHPLAMFRTEVVQIPHVPIKTLPKRVGNTVTIVGWLVTARRVETGNGRYMKFLTLEDKEGITEVTLFPNEYERYGHLTRTYGPYRVRGKVEDQHGSITITATSLSLIS